MQPTCCVVPACSMQPSPGLALQRATQPPYHRPICDGPRQCGSFISLSVSIAVLSAETCLHAVNQGHASQSFASLMSPTARPRRSLRAANPGILRACALPRLHVTTTSVILAGQTHVTLCAVAADCRPADWPGRRTDVRTLVGVRAGEQVCEGRPPPPLVQANTQE